MPLQVLPVEANDFDVMSTYVLSRGGDLSGPIVPFFWPPTADEAEMAERTRWSMKQQREIFEDDLTAHFMKVVDTDRGDDIIALARWHYYERGYRHSEMLSRELNGAKPDAEATWPPQINVGLAKALLDLLLAVRPEWQGQRPMWVLTTLITREGDRRRGAGGMLVKWGLQRAIKDGVPAFIEASPAGKPLYMACGFSHVGDLHFDLAEFGFAEPVVVAKMAANLGSA